MQMAKITLYYRNGDIRELDAPYGMRHLDKTRAFKAVLSKEFQEDKALINKVLNTLHPTNEGITFE